MLASDMGLTFRKDYIKIQSGPCSIKLRQRGRFNFWELEKFLRVMG